MADRSDPKVVVPAVLLKSGFPFQTAVADVVRRTPGWSVTAEEFPWRDDLGEDHFLDLAAESEAGNILTIEAKKTDSSIYTFLLPQPARVEEFRARVLHLRELTKPEETSVARLELYCAEWHIEPASAEAAFCCVSKGQNSGDSRLLERDAQLLVRGTDAYAAHEIRRYVFRPMSPWMVAPIIPVIVTSAQLFVTRYEPTKVSLETGKFSEIPSYTAVNVVRFRKPFLSHPARDLGERTVLVVNAQGLGEVLRTLAPGRGYSASTETRYLT